VPPSVARCNDSSAAGTPSAGAGLGLQTSERARPQPRSGFTLAEVAITILIVGIVLVLSMQGLNNAMAQAGQTRNLKIARELGMFTLARLESAMYIEDIEDHMQGDYSEQDYADFEWEIVLGDEPFYEPDEKLAGGFDSWNPDGLEDDESESTEPWVVARIKVSFPPTGDRRSDIVLERWITREFVYGKEEEEEDR
jgi:prepilin-type N-terminal cleavage/methylation domain-containing protein